MAFLNTYKTLQPRGYATKTFYIEDKSSTSPNYFDIDYFPTVVGGGRHVIKFKGNGLNLRLNTTIDAEILDAEGKSIYYEFQSYIDRFNNYYLSFDIYDITAKGIATLYLVGEAAFDLNGRPIPLEQQNKYNVRWSRQFSVFPFERNNSDLVFDKPPTVGLAQVIVPARLQTQLTASNFAYTSITSSRTDLTIVTSNFFGYDRDFATSPDILDKRLKGIQVNPLSKPTTINSVDTSIRQVDSDVQNGYVINQTTRFNTIVVSTSSFFTKEYLGGYFEFYDSASIPRDRKPELPNNLTISGSVYEQLASYNSTIVEIINSNQAIISKPISVITNDPNKVSRDGTTTFTYKNLSDFTASITYVPTNETYVTSSAVSQSYIEFTFSDLNPISGQVYRIKTSTKFGSITGDFKLLNDQIIVPTEYLTDAQSNNPLNYARHESEYRLIGYFFTQSIADSYWNAYYESNDIFTPSTASVTSNVLSDSVRMTTYTTQSKALTTKYFQNYNENQTYTISFYLTLDPYTELEVYMGSDPLNSYVITPSVYPRAFLKSANMDKSTRSGDQNKFGKYIGKIVNDRAESKYYGKIMIDFQTDGDGFGAPVFRTRVIDEMPNVTARSYISEISIKPYVLNGYTPNIVQYAIPLPQELVDAVSVSQSFDVKIEYFDYTGRQSEYVTFIDDLRLNLKAEITSNACQDQKLLYRYDNTYYTTYVTRG